jgi:hypothetical protein
MFLRKVGRLSTVYTALYPNALFIIRVLLNIHEINKSAMKSCGLKCTYFPNSLFAVISPAVAGLKLGLEQEVKST